MAPTPGCSFFEGVFQIPPGHYLLADSQQVRILRYWDFDYPRAGQELTKGSDAEYTEVFQAAFGEAVRLCLRADVPVGCHLSGGLDSCAVLGLAVSFCSEPIRALTLAFDRVEYDESRVAEEIATKAGAEFCSIPIGQRDLADHFSEAIWHSESLFFNAQGVAKFLLSRAVHEAGYKVVLTGEGADEILAGYPHFPRDLVLYDSMDQDLATVAQLFHQLGESNLVSHGLLLPEAAAVDLSTVKFALGFVPSFLESFGTVAYKLKSLFSSNFAAEFATCNPYRLLLNNIDIEGQLQGRAPVNQSLYLRSKTELPHYVLCALGDRMEIAHSVEGRLPLLDHQVV
jgi:asparagine synthase (glutamine-hydrolysing)